MSHYPEPLDPEGKQWRCPDCEATVKVSNPDSSSVRDVLRELVDANYAFMIAVGRAPRNYIEAEASAAQERLNEALRVAKDLLA